MKRTIIREERLSDGRMAQLAKVGNRYRVMVTNNDECPDIYHDLNKNAAYKLLSDVLKKDLMS